MHSLQRKPRVFLSHSKKDISFVRRLESDLRSSQCEIWIDDLEIRHGRPWLDEIFVSGIPSCEVVLCYITENSASSQMVQREIDARVVERLANDRVTLLLYVETPEIRSRLRGDLQTFQIPVLNSDNYAEILPRIVSEIWRSYLDSAISQAVQTERVKRLELEIELRNLRDGQMEDIFNPQENAEFESIWSHLDRVFTSNVHVVGRSTAQSPPEEIILAERNCDINFGRLFRRAFDKSNIKPSRYTLLQIIGADLLQHLSIDDEASRTIVDSLADYEAEFLRYGFLERSPLPPRQEKDRYIDMIVNRDRFELIFTAKLDRFFFWMDTKIPLHNAESTVLVQVR